MMFIIRTDGFYSYMAAPLRGHGQLYSISFRKLERHSVERIPPPGPLMSQSCYHWTNAG